MKQEQIAQGQNLVDTGPVVTVIAVTPHGPDTRTLVYKHDNGTAVTARLDDARAMKLGVIATARSASARRRLGVGLIGLSVLILACGEDQDVRHRDVEPETPTGACAGAPEGLACDDGDPCTANDRCHAGTCLGDARSREPYVCDSLDNDCDGLTDEDCSLRITGSVFGSGATSQPGLRQATGTYLFSGVSTNGAYTLRAGP